MKTPLTAYWAEQLVGVRLQKMPVRAHRFADSTDPQEEREQLVDGVLRNLAYARSSVLEDVWPDEEQRRAVEQYLLNKETPEGWAPVCALPPGYIQDFDTLYANPHWRDLHFEPLDRDHCRRWREVGLNKTCVQREWNKKMDGEGSPSIETERCGGIWVVPEASAAELARVNGERFHAAAQRQPVGSNAVFEVELIVPRANQVSMLPTETIIAFHREHSLESKQPMRETIVATPPINFAKEQKIKREGK